MKYLNSLLMIPLFFAYASISANETDIFPEKVKAHLEGQLPNQKEKEKKPLTPFEKKLMVKLSQ